MTFANRKKLAAHFNKLGKKKHPYVVEMKKNKGDDPKTEEVEAPVEGLEGEVEEPGEGE